DGEGDGDKGDASEDSSSSEDDEEDQVDLAQQLERMVEEENDAAQTVSAPPKTENEVDGYNLPIQELETKLELKLSVGAGSSTTATTTDTSCSTVLTLDPTKLSLAGTVKSFMVDTRTVVVESTAQEKGTASMPWHSVNSGSNGLLDEGSLLVMRVPNRSDETTTDASSSNTLQFIALGRIFEVFGPVSRPLYTIRLPASATAATPSAKPHNTTADATTDAEEDSNNTVSKAVAENGNATPVTDVQVQKDNETKVEDVIPCTTEELTKSEVGLAPKSDTAIDPWAADGELTKYLSEKSASIQVFYVQDEAKLIDTQRVVQSSGKGCDASNLYDEEVMNSHEMYYSDDEQERNAKSSRRRNKRGSGGKDNNNNGGRQRHNNSNATQRHPRQYQHHQQHQRQQQQQYSSSNSNQRPYPVVPQGFHHQPSPVPQGFHNPMVPPPPPPPPRSRQGIPPPPPPPRGSNEPPAYQY
ncbi:MAG: hypothetical protein SGILL_007212, partial [Bacillariaceae sp.]